eukprot:TRINITY_DN92483_c0_g1_i1.p1 TRINITY_DN92483_c0_g1~~TRINITY_DN92483_c0_g1_i1.p1  ORF type:complete len:766 (+),score=140.29 TRINITY_DN92483_c0_g1_i1:99-2396(+)
MARVAMAPGKSDDEGDPQASLLKVRSQEDLALRKSIRAFRSDCCSRCEDCLQGWSDWARQAKAGLLSVPLIDCLVVATGRAAFVYDFASNGLVAKSMADSDRLSWCMIIVLFMLLPYLLMVIALHDNAAQRLAKKTELPVQIWKCLWPLIGGIICFGADVAFTVCHFVTEPTDPSVFHYLTLRSVVDLWAALLQFFFQSYILVRLENPGDFFPAESGIEVKLWLLVTSVLFSLFEAHQAWSKLSSYAMYQTGGSRLVFFQRMRALGEGLVPSHLFAKLRSRRAVTIEGAWSQTSLSELLNLGAAARKSDVLETLRILDAKWLTEVSTTDRKAVTDAIERCLEAPALRLFELRGAAMPKWIEEKVRRAATRHPCLYAVQLQGVEAPFVNEHLALVARTPLLHAATVDNLDALQQLPPQDLSMEALALARAAQRDSLEAVRALLLRPHGLQALHATVHDELAAPSTVLTASSSHASRRMIQLLVLSNADPNTPRQDGATAIFVAAMHNNTAVLDELLLARANPNTARQTGSSPIWIAAQHNCAEAVEQLLKARADPSIPRQDGATAVFIAAMKNSTAALAELLNADASPDTPTLKGVSPVYIAAQSNSAEALAKLLQARADPEAPTPDGDTAVLIAAQSNNYEAVAHLLRARANPETPGRNGITPVWIAAKENSAESLAELLEGGASPDTPWQGILPAEAARLQRSTACRRLLDPFCQAKSIRSSNSSFNETISLMDDVSPRIETLKQLQPLATGVSSSTLHNDHRL